MLGRQAGAADSSYFRSSPQLLPSAFFDLLGATGNLTRVSPATGSAGTLLTITGTGLGAFAPNNAVIIGGVPCAVSAW